MITDSRTEGIAGFPGGRASSGAPGHVLVTPPPAASIRGCGYPSHGLPTLFTAGVRVVPPGLFGPGCDRGSYQTQQPAVFRPLVSDERRTEAVPALVPFTDEDCDFVDWVTRCLERAGFKGPTSHHPSVTPAPQRPSSISAIKVREQLSGRRPCSGLERRHPNFRQPRSANLARPFCLKTSTVGKHRP